MTGLIGHPSRLRYLPFLLITFLVGCTGIPDKVTPVKNFQVEKYLGKWYEIARLDHSFEKGLTKVTAEYRLREDGGISVLNRGYSTEKGEWKSAEGRAYFVDQPDRGHLKVSFFRPFYASYVVMELDSEYQYALVCGPDTSYLWILAREPRLPREVLDRLLALATKADFDTKSLIWVEQE